MPICTPTVNPSFPVIVAHFDNTHLLMHSTSVAVYAIICLRQHHCVATCTNGCPVGRNSDGGPSAGAFCTNICNFWL